MADIKTWCDDTRTKVKRHHLVYLEADAAKLGHALTSVAAVLPGHYAAPDRVADILLCEVWSMLLRERATAIVGEQLGVVDELFGRRSYALATALFRIAPVHDANGRWRDPRLFTACRMPASVHDRTADQN